MKSKGLLLFIALVLLVAVFLGGTVVGQTTTAASDNSDAYYVENSGNVFIGLAKLIDKGAYFVVDLLITAIDGIFGSVVG